MIIIDRNELIKKKGNIDLSSLENKSYDYVEIENILDMLLELLDNGHVDKQDIDDV